jgi:hypothetical protein
MRSNNTRLLPLANVVAYVLMVAVNGLAGSTTIIGGKLTAEVSDANPTLVTPAGYTFSIWGVIYILLAVFVIYQAVVRSRPGASRDRIGWLFVMSSAFNILWLFAWQYEILVVSVIIMFLLLATLIAIYLRLGIGVRRVEPAERLAVHLPFSVYLGWITIATIANVAATLVSLNWDGFGIAPEIWAIAIIIVAFLIAALNAYSRRDVAYGAVIVWALVGIAVNQSAEPIIVAVALAGAVGVVVALVASILYRRRPVRRATA